MDEKTTAEMILYTLTGCPACIEIKDILVDEIKKGEVEIRECNIDSSDPKVELICAEIFTKKDFDGFPTIYSKDGDKEY